MRKLTLSKIPHALRKSQLSARIPRCVPPQRAASELLAVTWPALQILNLQISHRFIASLVRAPEQLLVAMAEKKSAAPSHPPYSALIKEAILSLKVCPRPDCLLSFATRRPDRAPTLPQKSRDAQGALSACIRRAPRSEVVELRAGEKWLIFASYHKGRGRQAPQSSRTLEEGAIQPRPEAEALGQVGSGKTGSAIPQLLPLLGVYNVFIASENYFAQCLESSRPSVDVWARCPEQHPRQRAVPILAEPSMPHGCTLSTDIAHHYWSDVQGSQHF